MAQPIRNITIVGGGTSGWITACFFARFFERKVAAGELAVTLIESPNIGIIGVGESTARPMTDLLRMLGLNEADVIKRCNATFKLGGYFTNWEMDEKGQPISWVNPFISQNDVDGVNPGYLFASYSMEKDGPPLSDSYTDLTSVCPSLIRACRGPRGFDSGDFQYDVPYSYHLDAIELAKILMERGKSLGVRQILDDVEEVNLDERGFVSELVLKEHGSHPIEFVIDATGFASVIIGKAMGEPFEPLEKYLLNDRAAVMQLPHDNPTRIEPTSRATGMNAGWSFRVPLYNRVGSGYVFSSKFLSDDDAIAEFKKFAGPNAADRDMRVIPMRIGKLRRSWVKNCLALGLSSGFVEPLEATAIYSVQMALRWFYNYFPDTDCDPALQKRYNELVNGLYSEIVDYICLLFHCSNRDDTDYWRAVRHEVDIPPRLEENLAVWRNAIPDELDLPNQTFFTPTAYRAALISKGYYKGRRFAQASPISEQHWKKYIRVRHQHSENLVNKLPDHYELLRHIRGEDGDKNRFKLSSSILTNSGI